MATTHAGEARSTTARAREEIAGAAWEHATWAAARAARVYLMTARGFRSCITSIEPRGETYRRALHVIERREVLLRTAPAEGAEGRKTSALPDPATVDPWTQAAAEIEAKSRVLAKCPECSGEGAVACTACDGGGALPCPGCQGLGRIRGDGAQSRPCSECRGQGRVACDVCESGRIACAACASIGRVVAWLVVDGSVFSHVSVHATGSGVEAHANLRSPADFDAGITAWPNPMTSDTGVLQGGTAVPAELKPPLDRRIDRLRSTRIQMFSTVVHRITYATPLGVGLVEMAGQPPSVCDTTEWRPLELRRALLVATFCVGIFVAFMVRRGYEARSPWFATSGHGGAVMLACAVAATFATVAFGGALLGPRGRSMVRLWGPLALSAVAVAAAISAYRADRPNARRASVSLTEGRYADARTEADAMLRIGSDEAAARWIVDSVHAHDVIGAADLPRAIALYREGFRDDGQRTIALASLRGRAETELRRLADERNTLALFALGDTLTDLDPPLASRARETAARFRVDECVQHHETECAFHGESLEPGARRFLEYRLAAARFEGAVQDGDFELAWIARERAVTAGAPDSELARLDALAIPSLRARDVEGRRSLANASSLSMRRDALVTMIRLARAIARFTGKEAVPSAATYEAQLAALDRTIDPTRR